MSGYRLLKTAFCGVALLVTATEVAGSESELSSSLSSSASEGNHTSHETKKHIKKETVCEGGHCREVIIEDDEEVKDCEDGVCVKRKRHRDNVSGEDRKILASAANGHESAKLGVEDVSSLLSDFQTNATQGLLEELTQLLEDKESEITRSKLVDILSRVGVGMPDVENLSGIIPHMSGTGFGKEARKISNLRNGNINPFGEDSFSDDSFFKRFFGGDDGFFGSAFGSFGKIGENGKEKVEKFASEQSISFSSKHTKVPVTKEDIEKNPKLAGEKYHQVDMSSISCRGRDSTGKDYRITLSKKIVDGKVVEDLEKTEGVNEKQLKEALARVFRDMPKARELFPEVYAKYLN